MQGAQMDWRWVAAAALAVLVAGGAAPAWAHARVIVGGAIGVPVHPYPPPYVVYPAPAPWPYYYEPAPPPGWVPGHWEWEYDRRGKRYRVWVPGHLR